MSFRKSSIVVPNKIYKVLTTFFMTITVEEKFAFIQMGFRVNVIMTQKINFSFSHILESSLWTTIAFMLKLLLRGKMPDILNIRLSDRMFLATSIIDFTILSSGNSELAHMFHHGKLHNPDFFS